MKLHPLLPVFALTAVSMAQEDIPDPTRPSPELRAALMEADSAIPEISIKGLVVGKSTVAMLEVNGGGRILARPGTAFSVTTEGGTRRLIFRRLNEEGLEIEAPGEKEMIVVPTFGPVEQFAGRPGDLNYVEFRDLPLIDALRMLADQSGRNYSASADANKIAVNVLLRNVSADSVVEEICKSHGLWSKRDPVSGILRIMTLGEFERDLSGFREEQTAIFTLRYPNVAEIAIAIEDLFGTRVRLSLGGEDQDNDMRRDLEERFDRFDILTERTQNVGTINGTVLGNNVNGVTSYGGLRTRGFGGFGSDMFDDRNSYSRRRSERRAQERAERQAAEREAAAAQPMTAAQAERIEQALVAAAAGREGLDVDTLRGRPAPIHVTASRRNNMIIVRTSDSRALDAIRAIVSQLDVQTPMVLLEVKVLSIELGKGFESAFEYAVTDGRFGGTFSSGAINPSVARDPITNAPVGVTAMPGAGSTGLRDSQFIFQYLGDTVRARLQLLAKKNRVKTIATPTLLTANNEVSRLFLGEERPLVRGINSQTIITDNNVATTPNTETEFRNVGNTLLITPNINADRTVTLRLVQENSFISPNAANIPVVTTQEVDEDRNGILPGTGTNSRRNQTGVRQVPVDVVGTRSVTGTFVAKDGMEVAIGGLIEEVDADRREGVPILSDIPGLGVLFRRQQKEKSRHELVIILRPYVMSTPGDSVRISNDVLERLAPESMTQLIEEGFLPEPVVTEVQVQGPLPDKVLYPVKK